MSASCLLLLLSGCVVATPIITPTGQQGFTINCSDFNDIGYCYQKAGQLCGSAGYEVFGHDNKPASFWQTGNQSMVVRCKLPGETAAPVQGAAPAQRPQNF